LQALATATNLAQSRPLMVAQPAESPIPIPFLASGQYKAPFNQIWNDAHVFTPKDTAIAPAIAVELLSERLGDLLVCQISSHLDCGLPSQASAENA
jgi:hypothetical protein